MNWPVDKHFSTFVIDSWSWPALRFKWGVSDLGGQTWGLEIQCSVDMANYQFTMLIEHLIAHLEQMAESETCPPLFGFYFWISWRRWGEKGAEDALCAQD